MASCWEKISSERVVRRRLLKGGAALSVGAAALALIGCGGDEGDSSSSSTPASGVAGDPKPGGTFKTVIASSSAHFNVFANYQEGYNLSGTHVYDRPITRRLDNRGYILEAAESVETPDPLKVVIKLKPGMVFQNTAPVNGRAVKASDIVAVQEYVRTLATAENPGFQKAYLEKAEATDDRTVVYTLKKPFAYLFGSTMLSNPTGQQIVAAEMLQGNMETTPPIGSGAFKPSELVLNTKYVYERNPTWREAKKGRPYFDKVDIIILNDNVAIETAFRGGQLDRWWNVPAAQVDGVVQSMGSQLVEEKFLGTGLFISNMRTGKAPWTDIRVREAFYRLTNRQQFVDLVFKGKAVIPTGPLHVSLPEYQLAAKDTESFFKTDIAQAKQLLSAANWDANKEYEVIVNAGPVNNTAAEVWSQQLSQGGVKVRPVPLPFAEWLPNRIGKGDFDLIIGATPGADTPFRAMRNHHTDTLDIYNFVGLGDKEIDALIEKTETTTNKEENVKLVKQLQMEVLKKYSGTYNYVTVQTFELRNPKIENYEVDLLQGQVFRDSWWFKT